MSRRKAAALPLNPSLAYLLSLDPALLAQLVEVLIAIKDATEPDPETEDGDEDCCTSGDDIGSTETRCLSFNQHTGQGMGGAGDPDDAEDDDPLEPDQAQGWGSNCNVGTTPLPYLVMGRTSK